MTRSDEALELAREAGFDLAGIAPLAPPPGAPRFAAWLEQGFHGGMDWLVRSRAATLDPRSKWPEARSLLVVGLGHARPPLALEGGGRVARYAAGRDYHNVATRLLRKLRRTLGERLGLGARARTAVDATPLLERSHAAAAGLGFESKAANLLNVRWGPWFFLGALVLEDELEPTAVPATGSCGTCRACLDACPTQAIVGEGWIDARRCISYLTIEHRGPVPHALRAATEEWAFGCDVCSEVCPWGREAPSRAERFGTHPRVAEGRLVDWLRTPPEAFSEAFRGSPLQRARREGLARNAALGLARARSDEGRQALLDALEGDPSPVVREAAGSSLARGYAADRGTRERLERAAGRESDPDAAAGLATSLGAEAGPPAAPEPPPEPGR